MAGKAGTVLARQGLCRSEAENSEDAKN